MPEEFMTLKRRLTKVRSDLKVIDAEIQYLARDIVACEAVVLYDELKREWRTLVTELADTAIAADESVVDA